MMSPRSLSVKARRICESPAAVRAVSVVSLWETLGKCSIGKLSIPNAAATVPGWVAALELSVLPVAAGHAYAMYDLPLLHRDPFDRMLIAQAIVENMVLVTSDENIHRYPSVKWVW